MDSEPRGDNHRVVKFVRLAQDLLKTPLPSLRVLDLGCGEGLYAIEFAQQGCEVLALEGRPQHLAKAEFAKKALGLENLRFLNADVRDVNVETYGAFDLIICSGILYHLDHPAVFDFLKALKLMCRGACIIDTRIALDVELVAEFDGCSYEGGLYREHTSDASEAQRLAAGGASLDNEESFWFTRKSLVNFLADLDYTTVSECWAPRPLVLREDRITLVACAGRPVKVHNEVGHNLAAARWPATGTVTPIP